MPRSDPGAMIQVHGAVVVQMVTERAHTCFFQQPDHIHLVIRKKLSPFRCREALQQLLEATGMRDRIAREGMYDEKN